MGEYTDTRKTKATTKGQVFILDNFSLFPIFPMLIEDIEDIFPYPVDNIENDERGLK
jgi:hypothetical protein